MNSRHRRHKKWGDALNWDSGTFGARVDSRDSGFAALLLAPFDSVCRRRRSRSRSAVSESEFMVIPTPTLIVISSLPSSLVPSLLNQSQRDSFPFRSSLFITELIRFPANLWHHPYSEGILTNIENSYVGREAIGSTDLHQNSLVNKNSRSEKSGGQWPHRRFSSRK